MTFQTQKRSQAQADVIAPRPARSHLRPLDQAELFQAAMIILDRPGKRRPFDSLQIIHLQAIGRPQFSVAVCGDDLEDADQPIAFEPDHAAGFTDLDLTHRLQPLTIRINFPVTLQSGQPNPIAGANQLQIIEARIPTIKDHTVGRKSSARGSFDQRLKMIVFGQRVLFFCQRCDSRRGYDDRRRSRAR